ncbi:hypothetical protein GCM10008955_38520 [Deinococcus malanensis]|uniref:Uncharacterized protein n=1 Tax=Deinococcus malanensis TaxID=1706855 RepID=A0ABQ2F1B4_9DEIO|nr:hypothetical protein GCM10008955_38520 [Deinococcus malanensis]
MIPISATVKVATMQIGVPQVDEPATYVSLTLLALCPSDPLSRGQAGTFPWTAAQAPHCCRGFQPSRGTGILRAASLSERDDA